MKTALCFTLFTFVTLTFMTNSFAQDTDPEYVVRVIYFITKDREFDPDIDTKLDTAMKEQQAFFADEMERHGFGRKTFRFETDDEGNIVFHHVKSKSNLSDLINIDKADIYDIYGNIMPEIRRIMPEFRRFETLKNINLVIADIGHRSGGIAARSGGNVYGWSKSTAFLPTNMRDYNYNDFKVIAHELGHTFGLSHDWRSRNYMMSYGANRNELSSCAAEWLNANKFFNPTLRTSNYNTKIQMLTPKLTTSPAEIRLQFEITDPDGLHQAQLNVKAYRTPTRSSYGLYDCKSLNGKSTIKIEFLFTDSEAFLLALDNEIVGLRVADVQGNRYYESFPIDFTDFLSSNTEPVSISDSSLEKAVRKTLGIKANSPITQVDMLKLREIWIVENQNITNIKGLEYAKGLEVFRIQVNMIRDITPLANLTKLRVIDLSGNRIRKIPSLTGLIRLSQLSLYGNQIKDITPLAALTNLEEFKSLQLGNNQITDITSLKGLIRLRDLSLYGNQIKDITPLAALTNLTHLFLHNNQISDVTPLENLVNLWELSLIGNPIKNRKPLLALLRKNPDIKIYLKTFNVNDTLPVTLSHFRAEHTHAGVILKWTTESEIDNAGFYIYRSPTKDGEFKVINSKIIQGAGTTGERNEYTWTDTTAKPNTVYYYRIEDVSHAGVREQLATVRLRGLISAAGKLTTRWADLKSQE